ncbi:unnamed protein product [Acanthoscelides obtectus]|uniref:Uncharacterized protein n=1 Tax=Acanthoscelides obtectus TaxID=200917 RepID=A0A9P0JJE7_ACAOB|nr:unnamed protein product [Acanthoscelides obtectus]CAK1654404.1 hypothetical protein AOBTE_LOCUS18563 [Acanthoscelides obtectus]
MCGRPVQLAVGGLQRRLRPLLNMPVGGRSPARAEASRGWGGHHREQYGGWAVIEYLVSIRILVEIGR